MVATNHVTTAPTNNATNRLPARDASEDDVLRWLIREARRRAAHALGLAAALPPQSIRTELELSQLYVGVSDLLDRLTSARTLLAQLREPALVDVVTDLQARTWVAASLLEARARIASGTESDDAYWQAAAESLERAYGAQLFA